MKANIERQRLENEEKQKKAYRFANIQSMMDKPSLANRFSLFPRKLEEVEVSFDSDKQLI